MHSPISKRTQEITDKQPENYRINQLFVNLKITFNSGDRDITIRFHNRKDEYIKRPLKNPDEIYNPTNQTTKLSEAYIETIQNIFYKGTADFLIHHDRYKNTFSIIISHILIRKPKVYNRTHTITLDLTSFKITHFINHPPQFIHYSKHQKLIALYKITSIFQLYVGSILRDTNIKKTIKRHTHPKNIERRGNKRENKQSPPQQHTQSTQNKFTKLTRKH